MPADTNVSWKVLRYLEAYIDKNANVVLNAALKSTSKLYLLHYFAGSGKTLQLISYL